MVSCRRSEGITRVLQYLRRLPALLVLLLLLEIEPLLGGVRSPAMIGESEFVRLEEKKRKWWLCRVVIECGRLWLVREV